MNEDRTADPPQDGDTPRAQPTSEAAPRSSRAEVLVLSGISGSGKTTALHALEDAGYFCVDNLPAPLLPTFLRLVDDNSALTRVALAMDVREGPFRGDLANDIVALTARDERVRVLFLDSREDVLVARFKTTRRPHPVVAQGAATTLSEAVAIERAWLAPIGAVAARVIDTTELNVHELKRRIIQLYGGPQGAALALHLMSFGFRHGVPQEADFVFDVRYLDNPYFVEALRAKTGLDDDVAAFVLGQQGAQRVLGLIAATLDEVLPRIEREGRAAVTVALGCTGGHHRSVAMCEALGAQLAAGGREALIAHRDIQR